MKFFTNSNINRTYIHAALQTFAENVGGVFVFVYMLREGLTVPTVFGTLGIIFLLRIAMRQAVVPVVRLIGMRNGFILGTLMVAGSYLFVPHVQGVGKMLFVYVFFDALSTTFYWTCHHTFLAKLGDAEHRGSQVSVRESINAVMGIVAPILGSFLLLYVGFGSAFLVAACVQAMAILPLLGAPNNKIAEDAIIDPTTRKYAWKLFFTDGLLASFFFFTWIIALFQSLGENYGAFGGTLALAGLVGAFMTLVMGRIIDLGHHKSSVNIAYGAMAISMAIKAFAFHTPWAAVAATAFGAIAAPLYMPVLMSRIYNMAKASACPLRFHVAVEGAWDLGTGLGCLSAGLLTWLGFSYFWPLILGLVGVALGYWIITNPPIEA